MTHYRLRENDPSAIVLAQNPQSGSYEEAKIYYGSQCKEIYLNDKQNFGIRFFNPLHEKIGARISFNGQTSPHLLVLNPGQDITLERFINENRKMVFETYVVDGGNQKAMEAIQNNGAVKVEFFKEKVQPITWTSGNYSTLYNMQGMGSVIQTSNFGGGTLTSNSSNISASNSGGRGMTLGKSRGIKSKGNITLDGDVQINGSLSVQNFNMTQDSLNLSDYVNESEEVETGRIEKGEVSNQSLQQVNLEFENYPFICIEYKLLPISQINRDSKEIRLYCTKCGYRIRKESYRFCPKCGEKL